MADNKDLFAPPTEDELFAAPTEAELTDDDLFSPPTEMELSPDDAEQPSPEEMGALEAGVTGFGQGASFGLTPIIAGLTGAAGELGEDVGDLLGLTTDAELEDQGFTVEDDKPGLQGLIDAYYEQRERQQKQESKAIEDQPVAAISGNVLGGMASMAPAAKAAQALSATGRAGAVASSILPKAESLKGLSTAGKIGVGAREGFKAGSLAGFGGGEAKLLEGELGEAAEESLATGIGGAAFGGSIPAAGAGIKKVGKFLKSTPGIEELGLGFRAGKEGIDIADDAQISEYLKTVAGDLKQAISKNFQGSDKNQLLQQADEIGARVAAGEAIEEVIAEIQESGAFGQKAQKQLNQFVEDLRALSVDYDPAYQKAMRGVEKSAAKKALKRLRKGESLTSRTDVDEVMDDIVPSENRGKVVGVEDRFQPKKGAAKKDLTTAAYLEGEVPLNQYDLDNMTLTEVEDLIRKMGQKGFEEAPDAATPFARDLNRRLRELSNEALESPEIPDRNRRLKQMFNSLESLGIKPKDFFSKQETVSDAVEQKIAQKIASGSATDFSMDNFLKYMKRADSDLAGKLKDKTSFARDLSKYINQSDASGSISFKSALGSAQKMIAKTGGLAGSGAKTVSEAKNAMFKRLGQITPEEALEFGTQLSELYGDKAAPFVSAITKAASAEGARKNALMYGIYQQPAFRKMLEDVGRSVTPGVGEANASDDIQENLRDYGQEEAPEESTGLEPQMQKSTPEVPDKVVRDLVQREGQASVHSQTTPYTGLKGQPNTRVQGSTDTGLYYDSLGKLTAGYGDLIESEEEAQEKMQHTPEQALEELMKNYRAAKGGADKALDAYGVDKSQLSEVQIEALNEAAFQLGGSGLAGFPKMMTAIREGDYEEAARQAEKSIWFEQTPNRVRKFQERIMQGK